MTDDGLDAPDGAEVDGYKRVGDWWILMKKTYYVTKYCLSQGVFKAEAEASSVGGYVEGYITLVAGGKPMLRDLKVGRDAFENAADAYKQALKIADARQKGLERKRAQIERYKQVWQVALNNPT